MQSVLSVRWMNLLCSVQSNILTICNFFWRWRSQLMWRVFFTSAIVAVVVRSAMGWCKSGKCGHFGSGGFIIWDISGLGFKLLFWSSSSILISIISLCGLTFLRGQDDYSVQELLPMAIIGVVGGLLGNNILIWCIIRGLNEMYLEDWFGMHCDCSRSTVQSTYTIYNPLAAKLFAQKRESCESKF